MRAPIDSGEKMTFCHFSNRIPKDKITELYLQLLRDKDIEVKV